MKPSTHRPTQAIINLAAMQANIKNFKTYINNSTEIWAVVKANGYGHGANDVALSANDLVSGFCVSNLDEAIELRSHGIVKPILVLSGIVPADIHIAVNLRVTVTVPSLDWLKLVIEHLEDVETEHLKYHIKVDSGMGRIGVTTAQEANDIIALADNYDMVFDGVFTHFATADEAAQEKFEAQWSQFNAIVSALSRRPKYVHSSNSAAGIWHKDTIQDIERLGDAMYGLNPSGRTLDMTYQITPALELKSELTHIKTIEKGATVGYGGAFVADQSTIVGTVPIGYADGWTRDMTGFYVLVNGQRCPIIGRISMDQMTIALPEILPIGTKVTLIGQDGDEKITVDDVAAHRGTINYEVVCLLSDRIKRIYQNG
ncbi:alanine racemase [Pseudolactococcus reticulitermitis]|uniref:Alanine racemase n=1 Tax=Pseudolactococcus reticulitermitis TaxID=2025039 RepID=A0A224WWB0_9LACT|nr:alanine racemase [Lactococcus reticulitermitis]GAX46639.1 alanine racemase [Lactococcus reticulitermitis]